MIKKRIIEYAILSLGILMLALSIYHILQYFNNDTSWSISESVSMGRSNNSINIEQEANRIIDIYAKDPNIGKIMFNTKYSQENNKLLQEKLGIDMDKIIGKSHDADNFFITGTGCDILRIATDSTVNFMWTNTIEDGNVSFTIKNINGEKVFYENRPNHSLQDKITLEAGDYFIYKDFNNVVNLQYNLFIESN